jgi:sodium/potassium-transporting ATPase subunit alpha
LFFSLALNMPVALGGLLILSIDLITEQGPAISLAYEPAESNVMARPPRDLATDRLVSAALLRHSYLVVGVAEAVACMLSFFAVFWWRGVPLSSVYGSTPPYWSGEAAALSPDLSICAGGSSSSCRVLTGAEQRSVYFEAQAAWYATLVACQFFHVWTCKTRRASLFKHGPMRNAVTAWGCAVAVLVMLGVVFLPGLQPVFGTAPVPGVAWLPAFGFGAWVFAYTELSKRQARRAPESWWARKMAW